MKRFTNLTGLIQAFFNRDWTISEKILLVIDCILFGMVLGAIWSPKRNKSSVLGSYNSGNGCGNVPADNEDE